MLASITQPCGPPLAASTAPPLPHSPAAQPEPAADVSRLATSIAQHTSHPSPSSTTQHLHVASAVLACGRSFATDALAATAPELLVFLVKHCAAAKSQGMFSLMRGYHGRPGAATAGGGGSDEGAHHSKLGAGGSGVDEDAGEELDGLDPLDSALEWFGSGMWGAGDGGDVGSGTLVVGEDSSSSEGRRMPGAVGLSRAASVQPGASHGAGGGGVGGLGVALGGALTAPLPPPRWEDVALDRRLALLLALMARCALDPDAFARWVHRVQLLRL